jgi:hypothetical protein
VHELQPDVVLVDITREPESGLYLARTDTGAAVILISTTRSAQSRSSLAHLSG